MKKLLFLVVVLFVVGIKINAQTIIGKIENNIGVITINETILKTKWENYLKTNGLSDANLDEFKILKTENGTYFMVAKDKTVRNGISNSYGVSLVINGYALATGESTCTCTGCTEGCDPEHINGNEWRCTPCWPQSGQSCTKSVTAKSTSSSF